MEHTEQERKPYESPAIIYEAELEVRGGTKLGIPDLFDPAGTGVQE